MDKILIRLDKFCNERKISKYKLTALAGLSENTIYSWYRKGAKPSIDALQKVCQVLGINITQLLEDDAPEYTLREHRLIENFRLLNEEEKETLEAEKSVQKKDLNELLQKLASFPPEFIQMLKELVVEEK